MGKRWYVVRTKPSQEAFAATQLKQQNFTVYNPTYVKQLRKEQVLAALFPSYIFVQFDIKRNKRWRSINNTRGVVGLVGCTEKYVTPVTRGCIELMISQLDKRGAIKPDNAVKDIIKFSPNMQLKISDANYEGITGTYISSSDDRVTLMLTLLSKPVMLNLPIHAVSPAS